MELAGMFEHKKRTTKLLRTIGFQMPIELQQGGYIGSLSYVGQNVNINGESFSNVFKEANDNPISDKDMQFDLRDDEYKQRLKDEYG